MKLVNDDGDRVDTHGKYLSKKKEQTSTEKKKWWKTWWGIVILVIVFLFVIRVGHNYLQLKDAYQKELHKNQMAGVEKLVEGASELNEEQTKKIMELVTELYEILSEPLNEEQKEYMLSYNMFELPEEDTEAYIKFRRIYNIAWSKLSDKEKERCTEIDKEAKRIVAKAKK